MTSNRKLAASVGMPWQAKTQNRTDTKSQRFRAPGHCLDVEIKEDLDRVALGIRGLHFDNTRRGQAPIQRGRADVRPGPAVIAHSQAGGCWRTTLMQAHVRRSSQRHRGLNRDKRLARRPAGDSDWGAW